MNEDHVFHEYMKQNNGVMAQMQELVLSLSKSFQGLNAQHQQLRQRFQAGEHLSNIVVYTLLRHDDAIREHLGQSLERMTNPFPEESPEYTEFDSAMASLRTMLKQCRRAASVGQKTPKRTILSAPHTHDETSMFFMQVSDFNTYLDGLALLLLDAVNGGASLGFLPPLTREDAEQYWHTVAEEMRQKEKDILIVRDEQELIGVIQLAYSPKPNARHRAEIQKLCVHSHHRCKGIAQRLMLAAEAHAKELGKTLLVLDTRKGDAAEHLYIKLGYHKVGEIPGYTQDADGRQYDTTFFYKPVGVVTEKRES